MTNLSLVKLSVKYAGLHLSARPFQLFSVGLLIFGSNFCVGIYDRGGVSFSPVHDMWKDLHRFIQVIRRLSCDLSLVELGQDPTVKPVRPGHSLFPEVGMFLRDLQQPSGNKIADYPTYIISLGGKEQTRWATIGPPLWSSLSLLGRGTSVWKACRSSHVNGTLTMRTEDMFLMKNGWRNSLYALDAGLYGSRTSLRPGVAHYEASKDVCLPGQEDEPINVANLRTGPRPPATLTLYRLFLSTLGRPLFEYPSEVFLLKAIRAAIRGHFHLTTMNITHCDISIGNIFLSNGDNPRPGEEGFIADLNSACVENIPLQVVKKTPYDPQKNPGHPNSPPTESGTRTHIKFTTTTASWGATITGTVQFMALEVLIATQLQEELVRQVHHDLESFIRVLTYAVRRRLLKEGKHELNYSDFWDNFGQLGLAQVIRARTGGLPLALHPRTSKDLVSPAMISLFRALRSLVQKGHLIDDPVHLTYDALIGALTRTIDELGG